MYKRLIRKLINKADNWNDFDKSLKEYAKGLNNSEKADLDLNKLFETFGKYYFLSDPLKRAIFKNVWLFEEIPKDLRNKLKLKNSKKDISLLLEDKKGTFTVVKSVFSGQENNFDKNSINNILQETSVDNLIVFTNLDNMLNFDDARISFIGSAELKNINKNTFGQIKSAIKSDPESSDKSLRKSLALYKYSWKAIQLVWETSPALTVMLAVLTLVGGLLPAAMAYTGKLIIDAVVLASKSGVTTDTFLIFTQEPQRHALIYLILEALIIIALEGVRRGLTISQSLLRALLGQKVNVLILEKALTLDLTHFEDSEFYDKMTRARREASSRPLSLVNRTFNLIQSIISLVAYGALLLSFSVVAVLVLVITSIPSFIAETRFANQAFRLFSWRAPESREQIYLETLIAREDHAKEVKLYQLGHMMLDRYKAIFDRLYGEDRDLTIKRGLWGYLFSLMSSVAFYGAYAWIVVETITGKISLGEMTMYLTVFRQGQSTLSGALSSIGGMYEDNLYLSSLYEFLEQKIPEPKNGIIRSSNTRDGLRFENVTFSYPNSTKPALKNISLHIKPGEKLAIVGGNGSGKTTLIKLMTRLYTPDSGRILLDNIDLQDWDIDKLHKRIGVIFQNFVHYHFTVGENIGVGDVNNMEDEAKWLDSSEKGMALPFIKDMPAGFKTQLGTWFKGGQELSLGQWQKIALSRAFMRENADILVLDEPTSAMDAEAEVMIFEHFKSVTKEQMVLLISHRFSTVRMADKIAVMEKGELLELGTHEELLKENGRYAHLFQLQAAGYQ